MDATVAPQVGRLKPAPLVENYHPRRRNPFAVLLLCIVTLGLYWFVWNRRAFHEVAQSELKTLPVGLWILTILLYVLTLGVAGYRFTLSILEPEPAPATLEELIAGAFTPMALGAAFLGALLYFAQLFYLLGANCVVREVAEWTNVPGAASNKLVVVFHVLLIIGVIPILGAPFAVLGLILGVVWMLKTQVTINRYWAYQFSAPPGQPPSGADSTTTGAVGRGSAGA